MWPVAQNRDQYSKWINAQCWKPTGEGKKKEMWPTRRQLCKPMG